MPPGCFTSRVCEPYFSVASTYGFGKVQGCCTPTWISTSSGIFQNRSPDHKRCSPYEKQSLYCVQFCLVMTVPGLTSQSANAAAGAKIPKQITSSKPKRVEKLISPCLLFQKVTICKLRYYRPRPSLGIECTVNIFFVCVFQATCSVVARRAHALLQREKEFQTICGRPGCRRLVPPAPAPRSSNPSP